jgi:hypothetical protein
LKQQSFRRRRRLPQSSSCEVSRDWSSSINILLFHFRPFKKQVVFISV